jgi:hypothetical protein
VKHLRTLHLLVLLYPLNLKAEADLLAITGALGGGGGGPTPGEQAAVAACDLSCREQLWAHLQKAAPPLSGTQNIFSTNKEGGLEAAAQSKQEEHPFSMELCMPQCMAKNFPELAKAQARQASGQGQMDMGELLAIIQALKGDQGNGQDQDGRGGLPDFFQGLPPEASTDQ